jgi:uncharacterized OB-fold protein
MTESTDRPFTAASFNQFLSENKLMGSRCPHCQEIFLPPRAICPKCHSNQMEWVEMSGKGKLAAFTSIYIGPTFMNEAGFGKDNPYITGIVELEEGVKISALVLGLDARHPESIQIGIPLKVEFTEQGEGEARRAVLAFRT